MPDTPDHEITRQIDAITNEFEANWLPNSANDIWPYIRRVAEEHRSSLINCLIEVEFELRRKGNSPASPDSYLEFGDLDEEQVLELDSKDSEITATFSPDKKSSNSTQSSKGDRVRYFGEYELLDEIARGGMGVVFKARQIKLSRIVALKMILSGQLAGDEEVQRFKTEAEAAANLDHPGIVPIYEIGHSNGQHFFSMGFVEGRSLADRVKDGPLPPKQAAEIVKKIAEAIAYAHERGVIHRDLKPANILLDAKGEPRVTDFGLAKQVESDRDLTRTGSVMGTPSYMPPEQASGRLEEVSSQADVYSLGAILYCLLTGRPPFQSANPMDVLKQVLEKEPVSLRQLDRSIPRDLETICLKCLAKDASRRFESAASLAEDLDRWLKGEPILARPVGRLEKTWLWAKRNPIIVGAACTIFITILLAAGLIVESQRQNQNQRMVTAVDSLRSAVGPAIPFAIGNLEEFPSAKTLALLRQEFEMSDTEQRIPLAYALAHFGDARIQFLVDQIEKATPDEYDNFLNAFNQSKEATILALETAAGKATESKNWRLKTRLAMLALRLDSFEIASGMCQLKPNCVQRTIFIEECSVWHGDLSELATTMANCEDGPLRSGVALGVGSVPISEVSKTAKGIWQTVFTDWFRAAPDSGTHAATDWVLRKWNLERPAISASKRPAENRQWHVNTQGMTLVAIRAGRFVRKTYTRYGKELDQTVTLTRPFLMADKETTRRQFQTFMEDQSYPLLEKPEMWKGTDLNYSPTDGHPVTKVNWYDAILFCNWLSKQEGLKLAYERTGAKEKRFNNMEYDSWRLIPEANGYRLPTEAEWEYACRAGTTTVYGHGIDELVLGRYAVFLKSRSEVVGSRLPNGWGLFDLHGNVYEWCNDWYGGNGSEAEVSDPVGDESGKSKSRPTRGGSFKSTSQFVQSDARTSTPPSNRLNFGGFRVVRTITP